MINSNSNQKNEEFTDSDDYIDDFDSSPYTN